VNRDLGLDLPPIDHPQPSGGWSEKRRHPRRQLAVRCWIRDGGHTLYARVHDVSLGGLSIRAPVPWKPRAELELALMVASDPGKPGGEVAIRARGRVVWVRTQPVDGVGGAPRMGAEFLHVLDGEPLLRRLVAGP
jgi:hypothetical protein